MSMGQPLHRDLESDIPLQPEGTNMSVNLSKGSKVSLTKAAADTGVELSESIVACGWDVAKGGLFSRSSNIDLDLVAVALNSAGRLPGKGWFVSYKNLNSPKGVIKHTGDNLTGDGDGDDEAIFCDFRSIPTEIVRIVFAVNAYSSHTFGQVKNAFVRVYDKKTGQEFTRYDLGQEFSNDKLVVFGALNRVGDEWQFEAVGQGYRSQKDFRQQYDVGSF